MTTSSTPVQPPPPIIKGQDPAAAAQQAAPKSPTLRHVNLVAGQVIQVQGDAEQRWFESTRDRYLQECQFTEATDLQDLDRLLVMELMIYRWTAQIAQGTDYEGHLVDEQDMQRNIKLYSDQITKVKDSMGLSKKARDAANQAGNFSDYLADLKRRAKAFGIHRERQLDKALTLLNELFAIIGAFDRADEEEREKIGFKSEADILKWVRETARPEYEEIDEHFRQNDQRYWVREM